MAESSMRRFWDTRARENAAWYVDTSTDYDDPDWDQFFAAGRRIVAQALGASPVTPARQDVALEIGCGLGRICLALVDHFDRVVGVDISSEMLGRARELVTEPRIEFHLGDGLGLPEVADGSVDFVTSFTVLQHLPRRRIVTGYLREAARVLAPGGVLAVQWNSQPALRYRARTWRWRAQRLLGHADDHRHRDAPQFRGTPVPVPAVVETLEQAGLQVVGIQDEGTLFTWLWATRPAG